MLLQFGQHKKANPDIRGWLLIIFGRLFYSFTIRWVVVCPALVALSK